MTHSTPFNIVIPARFASSRFPAKALADIRGKPMIVRVAERASLANPKSLVIATDHQQIYDVVKEHGYQVLMTSEQHQSGTDRIAEVCRTLNWLHDEIIVNVQGDEPLIDPDLVSEVASDLANRQDVVCSTVAHAIHNADDYHNSNIVKVVLDATQKALYFSRSLIPFQRESSHLKETLQHCLPLRHVGLYAYRANFLQHYTKLTSAPIEQLEQLEQLRILWHGEKISVVITDKPLYPGVDTPEDLDKILNFII